MRVWNGPYYVSGEVGRSLSAGRVEIGRIGGAGPVLTTRSMDVDELVWEVRDVAGRVVPDLRQRVTLTDKDGVRCFTGIVTGRRPRWKNGVQTWQVVVSNAWWLMRKTQLVSVVLDAEGTGRIRPQKVFAAGDLMGSVRGILELAGEAGIELVAGDFASAFEVPQMTFSKVTFEEALIEALMYVPDAMTRVDYAVDGVPRLVISRRREARVVTLALGEDGDRTVDVEMDERIELEVAQVRVASATRGEDGRVIFEEEVAGAAGAGYANQSVVISGPELVDFLPPDAYDSVVVKSYASLTAWLDVVDSKARDYKATWGVSAFAGGSYTWAGAFTYGADGEVLNASGPPYSYSFTAASVTSGFIAVAFGADGTGSPPDWLIAQLGLVSVGLAGWVPGAVVRAGSPGYDQQRQADFWGVFGPEAYGYFTAEARGARKAVSGVQSYWLMPTTAGDFSAGVTVYREQDYSFIFPPAGLAENLLVAQSLPVWVGEANVAPGGTIPEPGDALNVTGGEVSWRTALAAVVEQRVDLVTGAAAVGIGVAAKADASGVVDRFRNAAGDVIA